MTETQRATIFGGEAERDDEFRPSYPSEIIDRLVEHHPETAVDAGCGTGKAARLVADEVAWTDRETAKVIVQRLASHSSHRLL